MDKFLNQFNEKFWYMVITILTAILLSIIGAYSDIDAAELPDETEPPVIEQPKTKTKKPVKKPKVFTKPVNKKVEETQYELVEDDKELAA